MRKFPDAFRISFIMLLLFNQLSSGQTWQWARNNGASLNDASKSVNYDAAGNSYVTGIFRNTIFSGVNQLTSSGGDDIFIAKYDVNGNLLWAKKGGGSGDDGYTLSSTTDTSGNMYVTGSFYGTATFSGVTLTGTFNEIFILKYDASGTLIFARKAGGPSNDVACDIAFDQADNIYITGYFYGTVTIGGNTLSSLGNHDILLAKFDAAGNPLWARRAGGSSWDNAAGLLVDNSGFIYVTGYYNTVSDFGPFSQISSGGDDVFVAKYDFNGNIIWVSSAHGTGTYDIGQKMGMDASGDIYLTGFFENTLSFGAFSIASAGNIDAFMAKISPSGNFLWAKRMGGSGIDYGLDISVMPSGDCYATGYFSNVASFDLFSLTSFGNTDGFVIKCDNAGAILWIKQAGGPGDDKCWGIHINPAGCGYVAGNISNTVSFDASTVTSAGSNDMFVARLITTTTPLPVELISFSAYPDKEKKSVLVEWQTASELNNRNFTIEKSSDGTDYTRVALVEGAGFSTSSIMYSCSDDHPFSGLSYYRLSQTDYNGNTSILKTAVVNIVYSGSFNIYVIDHVLIIRQGNVVEEISLIDSDGRIVWRNTSMGEHPDGAFQLPELTSGVYIVKLLSQSKSFTTKVYFH